MSLPAKNKLCIVIGNPATHSLSPQMHTAAYRELGLSDQYSFVRRNVAPDELAGFIVEVRASGIRGVTCTAPHKVAVMSYLDDIDSVARKIGAVNTIVNDNGRLTGYNTDWLGVVEPLEKLAGLKGKKVAIFGAGGAARAAAYGVTSKGAKLTIYNRTISTARELAQEFGAETGSPEEPADLEAVKTMDIIINASSVGMHPHETETPLAKEYITAPQVIFDAIYAPYETRLLKEAQQQGARVIHGTEMLLYQGLAQFKLYTGYDAPEKAMRKAIQEALGIQGEN